MFLSDFDCLSIRFHINAHCPAHTCTPLIRDMHVVVVKLELSNTKEEKVVKICVLDLSHESPFSFRYCVSNYYNEYFNITRLTIIKS